MIKMFSGETDLFRNELSVASLQVFNKLTRTNTNYTSGYHSSLVYNLLSIVAVDVFAIFT